ncbi:MAG: hypothetical protein ACRC26_03265 [Bacteroidales bacterium]
MKYEEEIQQNREHGYFTVESGRFIQETSKLYWKKNILDFYFKDKLQLFIFKNKNLFTDYLPVFLVSFIGTQTYRGIDIIDGNLHFTTTLILSLIFNFLIVSSLFPISRQVFKIWFRNVEQKVGFPLFENISLASGFSQKNFSPIILKEKNDYFFKCCEEQMIEGADEKRRLQKIAEVLNNEEYFNYVKNSGLGFGSAGILGITMLGLSGIAGLLLGVVANYLLDFKL